MRIQSNLLPRMLIIWYLVLFSLVHSTPIKKRVLVLGGSGRVGGSAVRCLYDKYGSSIELTVGGRKRSNWDTYVSRLGRELSGVNFIECDFNDRVALDQMVKNHDLIIHTAGPFQGLKTPTVMECTLQHGKLYLDVCDDINLSRISRSSTYETMAKSTGGIAVLSVGIWPGGSSLLAQKVIEIAGGKENVDKVRFSFFTAGSGGAGPTILTATFLILGENVLTYVNDQQIFEKSASDLNTVDFGPMIGEREVVRLNLIEAESCHASGIRSVETFFGTAPRFWNTLFVWMARLIPQSLLQNRDLMTKFALFSLPMVRLIDGFVGSNNGIRVDVTTKTGIIHTGLLTHRDLEKAVGDAIAAFADQLLKMEKSTTSTSNGIQPGIYFPEEVEEKGVMNPERKGLFREEILTSIAADAITYTITTSK